MGYPLTMIKNKKIELLSPAKNPSLGKIAINSGADALYIGPAKFGARSAASNSLKEIAELVRYAKLYNVKVYATLNTCLFDDELPEAQKLIWNLYETGVSGLIIQDMGIMRMELPDIPLIASTQAENSTVEKVKFLEEAGFSRVILARELTIDQIREISDKTNVELECFVHGALCVGRSGNCYMSRSMGQRSGNRGTCAQPCRKEYSLQDEQGNIIAHKKHLLSLRDLNLTDHLQELIEAGVSSFKIEGRLKESAYIINNTAHYRLELDKIIAEKGLKKSSAGSTDFDFTPAPEKTFNRGFTSYGIKGGNSHLGSIDTPKSIGEHIGTVTKIGRDFFTLNSVKKLNNADGICFLSDGIFSGTVINRVEEGKIYPQKIEGITTGIKIYRNLDHEFVKKLDKGVQERLIAVNFELSEKPNGYELRAIDEEGITVDYYHDCDKSTAKNIERAESTIKTQLAKLGGTPFICDDVKINTEQMPFFPVSVLNEMRRNIAVMLENKRIESFKCESRREENRSFPYPIPELDYRSNITNAMAEQFYADHGAKSDGINAEAGSSLADEVIMHTKYCIIKELGLCNQFANKGKTLYLFDEDDNKFRVELRCNDCGMNIYSCD